MRMWWSAHNGSMKALRQRGRQTYLKRQQQDNRLTLEVCHHAIGWCEQLIAQLIAPDMIAKEMMS